MILFRFAVFVLLLLVGSVQSPLAATAATIPTLIVYDGAVRPTTLVDAGPALRPKRGCAPEYAYDNACAGYGDASKPPVRGVARAGHAYDCALKFAIRREEHREATIYDPLTPAIAAEETSALVQASQAAEKSFLTEANLAHIVDRHAFGSTATGAGKFAEGAQIQALIERALSSDAAAIRPGAAGRFLFEHSFDAAVGVSREGISTPLLRVVIDPSGNIVTAFPISP